MSAPSSSPRITDTATQLLDVRDLCVADANGRDIVRGVSFDVRAGSILGLIGESGSGKTTTALACLGYARPGLRITGGTVRVGEYDLASLGERAVRELRGRLVAYVPQDPAASLNPAFRVEDHLRIAQRGSGDGESPTELLRRVRLPDDPDFLRRYTHQLSGGQQQRVAIAMALAGGAQLIILDEPTTGLDAVTKSALLAELRNLADDGIAAICVSHDLAAMRGIADDVAVMYDGLLVEQGPMEEVLGAPSHPYTDALLAAVPDPRSDHRPVAAMRESGTPSTNGCAYASRCPHAADDCRVTPPQPIITGDRAVRCLHPLTVSNRTIGPLVVRQSDAPQAPVLRVDALQADHGGLTVVDNVSFEVHPGECVALVGESGSGKTTIARCVLGLHRPRSGSILLDGEPVAARARERTRMQRSAIQIVFQNPSSALNPRYTVAETIARPVALLFDADAERQRQEVAERLDQVRLPRAMAERLPHELSGGERQRVAIAAALAARPQVLVCDEVTSALDVSVQAAVLDLLADVRSELGIAMLFITHDLGVVNALADRTLVLSKGRIIEAGPTDTVLRHPEQTYTRQLLAAAMPSTTARR